MTVGIFYVCLLVLGLLYAFIAGVMGWLADLGDADFHVDASGHLDAGHPHPISGTTVATFVSGFGAGGVVAHYGLGWPLLGGLATALVGGLALAAAAFGILELIYAHTQAGSEFAVEEMAGREGEVITSIPASGAGEVAYVVKGQREVSAARSVDGKSIGRGQHVVIEKVMGSMVFVRGKD